MMQSLKTMLAVDSLVDKPEELDLYELVQELTREMKPLFPEGNVECHSSIAIQQVKGSRRLLQRAMGELLRHGLAGQARAVVEIGSRPDAQGVAMILAIGRERILLDPALAAATGDAKALENRLELLVVRELAETWGGALRFAEVPGKGILYVLLIP